MRRRVDWVYVFALVAALLVMSVAACSGDSGEEIIEVSFDGNECTVAGATEVPPGDHAFLLTDVSGRDGAALYARKLLDGHTFQDALDIDKEAGGPGTPRPGQSWQGYVIPDFDPPEVDLADNQQLLAVSLEPGNHLLLVWVPDPPGSFGIWLCGPLDVVES
jgi:hypothetical protein